MAAALQNALQSAGRPIVTDSSNPYHRVWELLQNPDQSRSLVSVNDQ